MVHSSTSVSSLGLEIEKNHMPNITVSTEGILVSKVGNLAPKPNQPKFEAHAPKGKQIGRSQKPKQS